MSTKERITITLDPGILERIDAVAEIRGEARSAVIERMLRNGVGDEEGFVGAMGNAVVGPVLRGLAESPRLLQMIAAVACEKMTREEAEEIASVSRAIGKGVKSKRSKRGAQTEGA